MQCGTFARAMQWGRDGQKLRQEAGMVKRIEAPTRVTAHGNVPKQIDEHVGRVNTGDTAISVAHMRSPGGWTEPGQTPEFREVTLVLRGVLRVETREGVLEVHAGQSIVCEPGDWVRYSTPEEGGAEYVAICTPAFDPATVHRDA